MTCRDVRYRIFYQSLPTQYRTIELLRSIATQSIPEGSYVDDGFVVAVDLERLNLIHSTPFEKINPGMLCRYNMFVNFIKTLMVRLTQKLGYL